MLISAHIVAYANTCKFQEIVDTINNPMLNGIGIDNKVFAIKSKLLVSIHQVVLAHIVRRLP